MSAGRGAAYILEAFYYHQAEISSAHPSLSPSSAQNILSCVGGKAIFSLAGALREMATMEKSQGAMEDFEPLFWHQPPILASAAAQQAAITSQA